MRQVLNALAEIERRFCLESELKLGVTMYYLYYKLEVHCGVSDTSHTCEVQSGLYIVLYASVKDTRYMLQDIIDKSYKSGMF